MSYSARPYQSDFISAVDAEFARVDSTLGVMATGLGKTVAFSTIARDWHTGAVMVIAHRDELIKQAAEKIASITGQEPWIEKAEQTIDRCEYWSHSNIVVTSAQSMGGKGSKRRDRVFRWAGDKFGGFRLVIVDEAHRFTPGSQYDRVLQELRERTPAPVKLLGVTATPRRTDDQSLGGVFQSCAYQYGIADAIRDGWLVPIRQQSVRVQSLDFSSLHTKRNAHGEADFTESELEKILMEEKALHEMAAATHEHCGDRQGLVFCASVAHAKSMAAVLERYVGEKRVGFVCGETPDRERKDLIGRYKTGDVRFLCNCGVFTEGFDAPSTSAVIMGRPTKSLLLYTQIVGRGTRPLGGTVDGVDDGKARRAAIAQSGKPDCLVLDFVGNAGRHKLVNCIDVLGGDMPAEVRLAASDLLDNGDVMAALKAAQLDSKLAREAKAFRQRREREERAVMDEWNAWRVNHKRKHVRAVGVEYEARDVDPFNSRATSGYSPKNTLPADAPFKWQIDFLVEHNWTPERAAKLTRGQAFGICNRIKKGLARAGS